MKAGDGRSSSSYISFFFTRTFLGEATLGKAPLGKAPLGAAAFFFLAVTDSAGSPSVLVARFTKSLTMLPGDSMFLLFFFCVGFTDLCSSTIFSIIIFSLNSPFLSHIISTDSFMWKISIILIFASSSLMSFSIIHIA